MLSMHLLFALVVLARFWDIARWHTIRPSGNPHIIGGKSWWYGQDFGNCPRELSSYIVLYRCNVGTNSDSYSP